MRPEFDSSLLDIGLREVVEWPDGSCDTLRGVSGSLWITEYRNGEDVVLGAGQSLSLAGRRGVVVQGLRPSRLRVMRPVAHGFALRAAWRAVRRWLRAHVALHHHGAPG